MRQVDEGPGARPLGDHERLALAAQDDEEPLEHLAAFIRKLH